MVIMIETILAIIGDVEIFPTVIVVVSDTNSLALSQDGKSVSGTLQVPGQAWVRLLAEY